MNMKCFNCGKELPDGTGFCAECGTINSLDNDFSAPKEAPAPVKEEPKPRPDVRPQPAAAPAAPLPEPEDGDDPFAEMHPDALAAAQPTAPQPDDVGMPEYVSPSFEDAPLPTVQPEEPPKKPDRQAAFLAAVEAAAMGAAAEAAVPTEPAADDPFTVQLPKEELAQPDPVPQAAPVFEETPVEEELPPDGSGIAYDETPEVISEDDDGEDMYVDDRSGHGGVKVLIALLILAAVVTGGYFLVKNAGFFHPSKGETTTTKQASDTTDPSGTTDATDPTDLTDETDTTEPTDEDDTTEPTDEDDTTEPTDEDDTTAPTDEEDTTTTTKKDDTTDESTTARPTQPTTARPTQPTTARPTQPTTARPTQPTTARPTQTTAAPQPTEPTLQLPSQRIEKKTLYITEDGVLLRYAPNRGSASILSLSVGADVVVSGEENGYYFVYSNRYHTSGWVSKSYTASSRPVAQDERTVSGVVQPDVMTSAENKVVASDGDGLNLRKGPGTSYDVIRSISDGYPVVVKGRSSSVSGWVYVTDTTHGVSGWVAAAYLE